MIVIGSENGGVLRSSFPSSPWDSSSVPRQIRLLGVSFSSLLAEDFLSECLAVEDRESSFLLIFKNFSRGNLFSFVVQLSLTQESGLDQLGVKNSVGMP